MLQYKLLVTCIILFGVNKVLAQNVILDNPVSDYAEDKAKEYIKKPINNALSDYFDIRPTDDTARKNVAKDFSQSITTLQGYAQSAGGVGGLAAQGIEDIEKIEKKIKEDEAKKNAGPKTVFNESLSQSAEQKISGDEPVSDALKQIVKERGDEAKQKFQLLEQGVGNKMGPLKPYNQKSVQDQIADSYKTEESVTIPNSAIIPIWALAVEKHFADALAENSAQEFQRGLDLLDLSLWQLHSNPGGFVYQVNIPTPYCPTDFEKMVPVIGSASAFQCDLHGGDMIQAGRDVFDTGSDFLAPWKSVAKDDIREGGKNYFKDVVKDTKDKLVDNVKDQLQPDFDGQPQDNKDKDDKLIQGGEELEDIGDTVPPSIPAKRWPMRPRVGPKPKHPAPPPTSAWPESEQQEQ